MSPVRPDSKIPNGAMSFMKASIRGGFAELWMLSVQVPYVQSGGNLHFDNAIVRTYIQYLPAKLMCKMRYSIQMLVFVSQCLTSG